MDIRLGIRKMANIESYSYYGVGWRIELKNGTKIMDFDMCDEFCIRQQCFMQFGDYGKLIGETPWQTI